MKDEGRARPRVVLVTAVWRRVQMTRAFWLWAAWLKDYWAPHIELRCVASVSEPGHWALAREFDVEPVPHENSPLGAKFNATLPVARALDATHILIMGSDDIFDQVVADALAAEVHAGTLSCGLQDLYFTDLATGQVGYWRGYLRRDRLEEPAGCGRILARETLEAVHWTLWEPGIHKGMDHSSFRALKMAGIWPPKLLNVRAMGGVAIDCKTPDNLWSYDRIGCKPLTRLAGEKVLAKLPPAVVAALPRAEVVEPAGVASGA